MRDDLPPESLPRLHIVKLCVGAESVEDLETWQRARAAEALATGRDPRPVHATRMWPQREDEITSSGGSLYWVIKGVILARQRIEEMREVDRGDGVRRCALVLDPEIVRTQPAARRPFQGWRYLPPEAAPADLQGAAGSPAADLPPELARALSDLGVR